MSAMVLRPGLKSFGTVKKSFKEGVAYDSAELGSLVDHVYKGRNTFVPLEFESDPAGDDVASDAPAKKGASKVTVKRKAATEQPPDEGEQVTEEQPEASDQGVVSI